MPKALWIGACSPTMSYDVSLFTRARFCDHARMDKHKLRTRVAAARGEIEADCTFENARILDVFRGEWFLGALTLHDGVIVGLADGLPSKRRIDCRGKWIVPGFIDAHVHVESSLLAPRTFERAVLGRGTTTVVADPHELANVMGASGIEYFLQEASQLSLDMRVMISSCVPATHLETNGGGTLDASVLLPLSRHPKALGLAEVMNVPGVLTGSDDMMDKLTAFAGFPRDGHAPMVRGRDLSAYACARMTSCHESSEPDEALEKMRNGMSVWIREGSVAKDLGRLVHLLNDRTAPFMGFCTDDRNPLDIAEEGHLDHLIRSAIRQGIAPELAYRAASLSVARHYGMASSALFSPVGALAPGYQADLVVLDDAETCSVHSVYKNGVDVASLQAAPLHTSPALANTVRASTPAIADLQGPTGRVHVIEVEHGKILTKRSVAAHDEPGVMRLTVQERYGHHGKPANAYVRGFGTLRGAIASSVGHDSHNLVVVGSNPQDMRVALASLIECGGGFAVVSGGVVSARLALPFGGLMTLAAPSDVATSLRALRAASADIGCELPEPFLQLAFLSLPVIPSLKLTDKGLVDVDAFRIIDVRAA
jgi:adenine deaminase